MKEQNHQESQKASLHLGEEMEDTISLQLDDGEIECGIIASFPVEGKDYVALLPLQTPEGFAEEEVFLYAYTRDGDDFELIDILDDEEFDKVADFFDELLDDAAFNEQSL